MQGWRTNRARVRFCAMKVSSATISTPSARPAVAGERDHGGLHDRRGRNCSLRGPRALGRAAAQLKGGDKRCLNQQSRAGLLIPETANWPTTMARPSPPWQSWSTLAARRP
jgi:hypothetical protein